MNKQLANLICPGAQKAGSTTLWLVLRQHPEIGCPVIKEPGFFTRNYDMGLNWYMKLYKGLENFKYRLDFSIGTMQNKTAVNRMAEILSKDVKFIFLLRNPVDRAYSSHAMSRSYIGEASDFNVAFERDYNKYFKDPHTRSYYASGLYGEQITRFLEKFPKENMKFVVFEDFIKDIKGVTEDIFDFLEIGKDHPIDYEIWSNRVKVPTSVKKAAFIKKIVMLTPRSIKKRIPPKLTNSGLKFLRNHFFMNGEYVKYEKDPAFCSKIMGYYTEDIAKLEKIIGRDLKIWTDKYPVRSD